MAITAYTVLEAGDATTLNALVAAAITAGKQPFGPPLVSKHGDSTILVQAMITGAPLANDTVFDGSEVNDRLDALEADDTSVDSRLDALETLTASHTSTLSSHTTELADHESRITALEP